MLLNVTVLARFASNIGWRRPGARPFRGAARVVGSAIRARFPRGEAGRGAHALATAAAIRTRGPAEHKAVVC
jgi:hypothetical protein